MADGLVNTHISVHLCEGCSLEACCSSAQVCEDCGGFVVCAGCVAKWRRVASLERREGLYDLRSRPRETYRVAIYADAVKVRRRFPSKRVDGGASGGGPRGEVTEYSVASRRRFMERVHQVRDWPDAFFVHLTWPDVFPEDPDEWKQAKKRFWDRLRRTYPGARLFWRLERQTRKSGEVNAGKRAPHYHLLVVGVRSSVADFRYWVLKNWHACVRTDDDRHSRAGTRVDRIWNRRHAAAYASKYAAKLEDDPDDLTGCRWWGMLGFEVWHLAASVIARLDQFQMARLKRMMVAYLKSKGRHYWARRVRDCKAGFLIFGLGSQSREWQDVMSTAERMLYEVMKGQPMKLVPNARAIKA